MATPMCVDSGSTSSSSQEMVMELIVQIGQALDTIDSVKPDAISNTVIWNKHQCKRLAHRFNAIRERLTSMGRSSNDGNASDGGPIFDELLKFLKKGATLISENFAEGITSIVLSRTDNREAFQEIHEELDSVVAMFGFVTEDVESTPRTKLKEDAEADKKEMHDMFSRIQISAGKEQSQKLATVGLEKTTDVEVEKAVQDKDWRSALPSYLTIDQKSQIEVDKVQRVREYKRKSEKDPAEEVGWVSVKSGKWLGCDFAIKVFKCASDAHWNETQLLMEVSKLVELQHPHVVRLVGFGQDKGDSECVFVMELMDKDLRSCIDAKRKPDIKPFKELEELDIINQIAKGMYFMHTKGYAHGDLKCSNILVREFAGQYLEVKISDFRGSQKLGKVWDSKAFEQASLTRRPRWTAPEAIDYYGWNPNATDHRYWKPPSKKLLKKSDIYSFGMTCFEIVTGKYPFDGIKEEGGPLLERIKEGAEKWNQFPPELDEDLKKLITSCWNMVPERRPTFATLCHLLHVIRSRKLTDVKSYRFSGGRLAAIWSGIRNQIKRMPVVNRIYPEVESLLPGDNGQSISVELLRSDGKISVPEYLRILPTQLVRVDEPIRVGSHGKVFKATWLGCTFAVKILMHTKSNAQDLQEEVNFLIKVSRHPCIVQMVGLSKNSKGEHSIVMEYMDGNLQQLIATRLQDKKRKGRPFTFHEEKLIITKISWGMAFLHSKGLVHRDLNSVNVLAQDYSRTGSRDVSTRTVDVKIVDFGRSYLQGESELSQGYYTGVGSGFYRAPEMLPITNLSTPKILIPAELPDLDSKADLDALKATDVYSFAMLSYEVLTGESPPCSNLKRAAYAEIIEEQYRPNCPSNPRSPQLKVLIERCWSNAPKERPTFIEICEVLHDIFKYNLQV